MSVRHIIPISGKDSLATAIIQTQRRPDLEYEFIYNDTSMELPETYAWIDKVESSLGIKIIRCGKNLETVIYEQGILPSHQWRYCTKFSKIFPMKQFISDSEAIVYIGLRADEDRGGLVESKNMKVCYPLREEGIGLSEVYGLVKSKNLMPPKFFWKRVFDLVSEKLGVHAFILNELPEYIFDQAFAWRSRPNCFNCFYQRRYEWVGLLEHHPDLFGRAERIEIEIGEKNKDREISFYWIGKDFPLSKIRDRAQEIVASRVDALYKLLYGKLSYDVFQESMEDDLSIAGTSCGLYCGK